MHEHIRLHRVAREEHAGGRLAAKIALPDDDSNHCSAGTSNSNIDGEPSHSILVLAKTPEALERLGYALVAAACKARMDSL